MKPLFGCRASCFEASSSDLPAPSMQVNTPESELFFLFFSCQLAVFQTDKWMDCVRNQSLLDVSKEDPAC